MAIGGRLFKDEESILKMGKEIEQMETQLKSARGRIPDSQDSINKLRSAAEECETIVRRLAEKNELTHEYLRFHDVPEEYDLGISSCHGVKVESIRESAYGMLLLLRDYHEYIDVLLGDGDVVALVERCWDRIVSTPGLDQFTASLEEPIAI